MARELSHPFYESLGYSRSKTQHVYRKTLASAAPRAVDERIDVVNYDSDWPD